MKRYFIFAALFMVLFFNFSVFAQEYVLLGWNDLGMHCSNKDFSNLAVLPPYNNLMVQVIEKGSASQLPKIITTGLRVTYEIPGNTYSVGKTNFWDYEDKLFCVTLAENTGLTGAGLTGALRAETDHFIMEGIPLTPFTDADLENEDPYQLALVKLFDGSDNLLATSQPVIPVSNEIGCVSSNCHSSEQNILDEHEEEGGFNPNNKPILCASCHASNALGTTGQAGLKSLSQVIHEKHGEKTNDCYKCHPGNKTKCLRDVMYAKGMVCQDCHGSVSEVGRSIGQGRKPWFNEPACGNANCHGENHAEEPGKLFRQSKGHGGLYCSACHGSPHAILPSVIDRDNVQVLALQDSAGVLKKCEVCHGTVPLAPGPHGFLPSAINLVSRVLPENYLLQQNYPNPFNGSTIIPFSIQKPGKVRLTVFDTQGKQVLTLVNQQLEQGTYQIQLSSQALPTGVYHYQLTINSFKQSRKLLILK